ncbi:MAG: ABC transporter permease [Candidatus Cloacimonetes bacterium]|nr:ABC transporter permease [Candidatus Cloacimonadota bacterium]
MSFNFFAVIGEYILFISKVFARIRYLIKRRFEIVIQCKKMGIDSLPLIALTAAFTGLVTALQAVYQTKGYIPVQLIGVLVGKSTMIELAPVLTALVLTGKIGAAITAEIGTMRVSEQLDALNVLNIDPKNFVFLPRIIAGLIVIPLLTIFAMIMGIGSAWYFSWLRYGIHQHTFFNGMKSYFMPTDLWGGVIKSLVFGFFITTIGCFMGDRTTGGAEGVGRSTMQTVVYASILILISDFIVAALLFNTF